MDRSFTKETSHQTPFKINLFIPFLVKLERKALFLLFMYG
jgi:hypothetical protein